MSENNVINFPEFSRPDGPFEVIENALYDSEIKNKGLTSEVNYYRAKNVDLMEKNKKLERDNHQYKRMIKRMEEDIFRKIEEVEKLAKDCD